MSMQQVPSSPLQPVEITTPPPTHPTGTPTTDWTMAPVMSSAFTAASATAPASVAAVTAVGDAAVQVLRPTAHLAAALTAAVVRSTYDFAAAVVSRARGFDAASVDLEPDNVEANARSFWARFVGFARTSALLSPIVDLLPDAVLPEEEQSASVEEGRDLEGGGGEGDEKEDYDDDEEQAVTTVDPDDSALDTAAHAISAATISLDPTTTTFV